MGRVLLVGRLVAGNLRRRPVEAGLLMLAIVAATATLTIGLILNGVTSQPYLRTRAVTAGPDVVASVSPTFGGPGSGVVTPSSGGPAKPAPPDVAALTALEHAPGVTGSSGPYPLTWVTMQAHGLTVAAEVEGRGQASTQVDRPRLTAGSWLRPGGVVIERAFAQALGVGPGDSVTLNGRSFRVAGVAVTAAFSPYPQICAEGCFISGHLPGNDPGLVWASESAAKSLASSNEPVTYYLNLKLANPASADAFVNARNSAAPAAPFLVSWQQISEADGKLVANEQRILLIGSWLLGLLAVASVAVLVGGRMADQTRRVGLVKAVGGTPGLVAGVLLAEYLVLALIAAGVGLVAGWLTAPLLANLGSGLLGAAAAPSLTLSRVLAVLTVALLVAVLATLVPAVRAARTSTVHALADVARPPRRRGWLIALSARLPVPLLLGLRVAARRPRRAVLTTISVAITISGIVAVLCAHAVFDQGFGVTNASGLTNPRTSRLSDVMLVLTIMLATLAAVNAIFITWATALDARHTSALTRALGATSDQVIAGLAAAQSIPVLVGTLLGIPGGIGLFSAVRDGATMGYPPAWWLILLVLGTMAVAALLTAITARIGVRRPIAEILQAELA
ncbi:MAG TPA: FtsX-like permease family protein [Streptosporangiaceae bacterium]|jgi:putative ABC transport system permease protein